MFFKIQKMLLNALNLLYCKFNITQRIFVEDIGKQNVTENMYLLKMSGPQIRLCLFTFRPIAWEQLNNLLTIKTLS